MKIIGGNSCRIGKREIFHFEIILFCHDAKSITHTHSRREKDGWRKQPFWNYIFFYIGECATRYFHFVFKIFFIFFWNSIKTLECFSFIVAPLPIRTSGVRPFYSRHFYRTNFIHNFDFSFFSHQVTSFFFFLWPRTILTHNSFGLPHLHDTLLSLNFYVTHN